MVVEGYSYHWLVCCDGVLDYAGEVVALVLRFSFVEAASDGVLALV